MHSEGLLALKEYVMERADSEEYKNLKRDMESCDMDFSELRSVTIGVNLDESHTHQVDIVFTESAVVGEQVFYCPVTCLVLIDRSAVYSIGILVVDTSTCKVAALGRTEVQTNVDTIAQTLDPRSLQLSEEGVVRTDTLILAQPYILVALNRLLGNNRLVVSGQCIVTLQVTICIIRT